MVRRVVLKESFPELFKASCLKNVLVAAMGGWRDGVWYWGSLGISNNFFEDNGVMENFFSLKERLEVFDGWSEGKDEVAWHGNLNLEFSVAWCYSFYESLRILLGPINKCEEAYGLL